MHPDTLFYAFTVILVATVSTCILATLADFYQESNEQKLAEKNEKIDKNLVGRSGFFKYFLAFSLMTNGRSLLRVSKNPNNLKGVECIRFISFTWVISGHIWGYMQDSDNTLKTLNILKNRDYEIWVNAFFSVDTFFFLSGLMLAYSFLPKLTIQKALSPPVWVIFYIHRFLRLTPAYLTFMMFYATYGLLTDFGPNESVRTQDMKDCRLYGWKNLLYINNIYEPRKYCMGISWYLAADTQMYLISPFFLVAFLLGPIPGLICCALIIFVSTLLNYWLFLRYSLPLTLIQAHMTGDQNIIHLLQDLVYEAAYIRIPPFIFGIIMGYILWKTRDQQRRIRMNIGLVFLLWIVAVCLALGSIFTIFSYNRGDYWTPLERASYYAFSRIAWSLALCWVIFAINRGYSGLIGKFMSLKFWTPLGKLTFCGYLCHILVVAAILNMERTPMHFVGPLHTYISKVLPAVICTCVLAAAWTLVFEMPFAKLEGFLIQRMAGGRGKVAPEKEKPECTKI
uniref:Acyl_transf_3 domain-containing protein n=1 Tax=Caenorhabditis japonica TaxID=281687 RepID=A0A8R1HJ87_CAEJA